MQRGLIKHTGITIFEMLLVLAIAMSILLLSIKQYQSYKIDSDVSQVRYNVDQLFQAASYYYQGNCRNQVNSSTGVPIAGSGALDPANNPSNPTVVQANTLYTARYLSQPIYQNRLVAFDPTSTPMKSYVVQFNLKTPQAQRTVNLSGGGTANVGTIYVWKIQVAVLLNDTTTKTQYLALLGGDCLSRLSGGGQVIPCPSTPTAPTANDNYVVFERLPSLPSTEGNSGLGPTNVMVKQFNQQYTTYPILYLTGGGTPSPPQNYLCGT